MNIIKKLVAVALFGLFVFLGSSFSASADDWQAVKLRGGVFALADNAWVQLGRNDVVSDDRIIRTDPNGRVQFRRGKETIELGPNTQIRIFDRQGQGFTTVQQHFGEVSIEAERRNVQHFVVQTKYLAAVVKGTRFTVISDEHQASVKVLRGQVEVRDVARRLMVNITPGQSASVGDAHVLSVSGPGVLPPVVGFSGQPLAEDVTAIAINTASFDALGTATKASAAGANADAGGLGNGNAYGLSAAAGPGNPANSHAGGNGKGEGAASANANSAANSAVNSVTAAKTSATGNAGGNGNGNAYGLANDTTSPGNSENSNAGGNGKANKAADGS